MVQLHTPVHPFTPGWRAASRLAPVFFPREARPSEPPGRTDWQTTSSVPLVDQAGTAPRSASPPSNHLPAFGSQQCDHAIMARRDGPLLIRPVGFGWAKPACKLVLSQFSSFSFWLLRSLLSRAQRGLATLNMEETEQFKASSVAFVQFA
ncbi:hypothetical protein ACJZ2D_003659 [Fusarium nematophilum]